MEKARKKIRFSIRLKAILLIVVFGLVMAETAMVNFSLVISNNNQAHYKDLANDLASTVALSLDPVKTKTLTDQVVSIYEANGKPTREKEGTPEYDTYLASFDTMKASPEYQYVQDYLRAVKGSNRDVTAAYIGCVDFVNANALYVVYDEEDPLYPVGMADPLYEEDYPMLENPELGFVPSIYTAEWENEVLATAGKPMHDDAGNIICYAFVDISMKLVRSKQADSIVRLFFYLLATVFVISVIGVVLIHFGLVKPLKTLQGAAKSYDASNPTKTHEIFSNLKVNSRDEAADLADSMREMENDIFAKYNELIEVNKKLVESQQEAEKMTAIANTDALTGVYSKSYYLYTADLLNKKIKAGEDLQFGIVMVDLNYLKYVNDEFGHDSGDAILIKLANTLASTFKGSKLFRIGGDEFALILTDENYSKSEELIKEFNAIVGHSKKDDIETPSAALGYAVFDKAEHASVDDVLKVADKAMYIRKREMKSED